MCMSLPVRKEEEEWFISVVGAGCVGWEMVDGGCCCFLVSFWLVFSPERTRNLHVGRSSTRIYLLLFEKILRCGIWRLFVVQFYDRWQRQKHTSFAIGNTSSSCKIPFLMFFSLQTGDSLF